MSEHGRHDDKVIDIIRAMLEGHIREQKQWNKDHDEKSEIWRTKIESRFQPLEDLAKSATWSYKLVLGIVALGVALYKFVIWFMGHVRPTP